MPHTVDPLLQGPILYALCSMVILILGYLAKRAFEDLGASIKLLGQQIKDLQSTLVSQHTDAATLRAHHGALAARVEKVERKAGL